MKLPIKLTTAVAALLVCAAARAEQDPIATLRDQQSAQDGKANPQRAMMVKYALLMPNDKTSERVKQEERNPFGKAGRDEHKLAEKGSNEENQIRDRLIQLRVSGAEFDPVSRTIVKVLLGDMILSPGQSLPPVMTDQTLELKVGELSVNNIQLFWVEKRTSGMPPRKLTIPVDLLPFVRYRLLGQVSNKDLPLASSRGSGKPDSMGRQFSSELAGVRVGGGPATAPEDNPPATVASTGHTDVELRAAQLSRTETEAPAPKIESAKAADPVKEALSFLSHFSRPDSAGPSQ